ncbi:MAG: sigma-54-dependent Fis family transcriptional regulator [Myxococcales bacterium]|nr:MAG: sigma-54-dependent Fis family transcriptional regulator [Myxococcales bacterium]
MSRNYKILVVDDEPTVRTAIGNYLKTFNFSVYEAEDGEEAKQFLGREPLDLVITDVNMPRFDGLQLLSYVREHNPTAPVIVITGYGTIDMAVEVMRRGAFIFLQKPIKLPDLKDQVEKALDMMLDTKVAPSSIRSNVQKEGLIGRLVKSADPAMKELFSIAKVIAPTDSTVLITGESGTGKEMLAQYIHYNSNRTDGPLVPVNCGAIPENLMESELFGHVKGAFTGAIATRKGRLKNAEGGTLFLDEVGELPAHMQVKLLRVLQTKEFEPVGSSKTEASDFRVIAATNKDLEREVEEGRFREDLYYRLNVIPLHIPPLRARRDDIPRLVEYFVERFNREKNCRIAGFADEAMSILHSYGWPGNIRELENIVERMVIIKQAGLVEASELPAKIKNGATLPAAELGGDLPDEGLDFNDEVDKLERRMILMALKRTGGNRNQAAKVLNLNRTTLVEKIKKKKIEV